MPAGPACRFAPSPTGYLHVGGARTALFNWLFARATGGHVAAAHRGHRRRAQPARADRRHPRLAATGSASTGTRSRSTSPTAPTSTATRPPSCSADGQAYWCDCTAGAGAGAGASARRAARLRRLSAATGISSPATGGPCGSARPTTGATAFDDLVRGQVAFEQRQRSRTSSSLRSNGTPMFLLANVVDDADMGITHVIRGEDHVNGTPEVPAAARDALGYDDQPVFAHLPLLVNEQRKKLSKRRDDVAVGDYQARGFLPEAMRNYLALLGWGPRRRRRGAADRGDRRAVPARGRHPVAGVLRHQEAATRSTPSGSGRSTPTEFVRAQRPFLAARRAGARRRSRSLADRGARPGPDARRGRTDDRLPARRRAGDRRRVVGQGDGRRPQRHGTMLDASIAGLLDARRRAPGRRPRSASAIEAAAVTAGLANAEGKPQLSKARARCGSRSPGARSVRRCSSRSPCSAATRTLSRLRRRGSGVG